MGTAVNSLMEAVDFTAEERKIKGLPSMLDATLEKMIDEASQFIENETQQFFIIRDVEDEPQLIKEPKSQMFLDRRPITDLTSITDPTGGVFDLTSVSVENASGILRSQFWITRDSKGNFAPYLITYSAGLYETKTDVPEQLKNACKLVIAWRWQVNAQLAQGGDMIPMLIKQALTGYYAGGAVCF